MNVLIIILSTVLSTIAAWYLTRCSLAHAVRREMLDVPSHRSSHATPTPRGGGVAFVLVFLCTAILLEALKLLVPIEALGLLLGVFIAAIGYWDDRVTLSAHSRLLVQLAATAGALYCFIGAERLHRLVAGSQRGPIALFVLWLSFVWLVNLTNFMDGIDGLAGTEAVTVALSCCVLSLLQHGPNVVAMLYGVLAAAVIGFLIWNWFPAKIFMGDVGSCFLGYCFGVLCLLGVVRHLLSPIVPLILLGVFILDASVTLGKRVLRGERWLQPHRTHAFQHLSCRLGHERTTLIVAAVNLLWLCPWAAFAQRHQAWAIVCLLAAWAPILAATQWLRAGERDSNFDALAWTDLKHAKATRLVGATELGQLSGAMLIVLYRAMEKNGSAVKHLLLAILNFVAVYLAVLTRFDGRIPQDLLVSLPTIALVWTAAQSALLVLFSTARSHWRFTSFEEIPRVSGLATLASLGGAGCAYLLCRLRGSALPESVYGLDVLYSVSVLTGLHFLARTLYVHAHRLARGASRKRVLIYGANEAGLAILTDLRCYCPGYRAIGFIDERPGLKGMTFSGLRVLGSDRIIGELAKKHRVKQVLFPSTILDDRTSAVRACMEQNVNFRLVSIISEEQLTELEPAHAVPIAS